MEEELGRRDRKIEEEGGWKKMSENGERRARNKMEESQWRSERKQVEGKEKKRE